LREADERAAQEEAAAAAATAEAEAAERAARLAAQSSAAEHEQRAREEAERLAAAERARGEEEAAAARREAEEAEARARREAADDAARKDAERRQARLAELARLQQLASRVEALGAREDLTLKAGDRALRDLRSALGAIPPLPSRKDYEEIVKRLKAAQSALTPKVQELRNVADWQRWA